MDKLTHTLTVKVSPDKLPRIQAMAAYRGMEVSEYVRHLLESDERALMQKRDALNAIFGNSPLNSQVFRRSLGTTGVDE